MFKRANRFSRFRKANKSDTEKDPLKFYSIFNPHSISAPVYSKGEKWIQCAAIDVAVKNNAIRVERWHPDDTIETIEFSHTDFTIPYDKDNVQETGKENFFYTNACDVLKEICENYLEECHYIVIESQLSFAYDNVRIQSHITCALCIYLKDKGNRPLLIEMDPKLKTRLLGAPAMKDKKQIKQWAINKACEFFTEEGDLESLQFMKDLAKSRKSDDIADTKCYLKALEILLKSKTLPKIHQRPTLILNKCGDENKKKIVLKIKNDEKKNELNSKNKDESKNKVETNLKTGEEQKIKKKIILKITK